MDKNGSYWIKTNQNGSNWIKMDQTWINWIYHYLCRLPLEDEEATANSLEPGLERLLWLKKPESVIAELVLGRLVGLWLLLLLVLLELVKVWVAKSQPSFCQILHIFPILNKITQFFSYCNKKLDLKKMLWDPICITIHHCLYESCPN